MERMTTDGKLLAQDDIDALLGQAGLEGGYNTEKPEKEKQQDESKRRGGIRFTKRTEDDVRQVLLHLFEKAFLEREDDVKVIWNAMGTIPMGSGLTVRIEEREYVSLGVLYSNHLVVRYQEELPPDQFEEQPQ